MSNRTPNGNIRRGRPTARRRATTVVAVLGGGTLGLLVCAAAHAEGGFDGWSGPFQLLLRGVYLDPQNRSVSQSPPELHVDGGLYGELSAAWFMTPTFSMELSLAQISSYSSTIQGGPVPISSGPIRLMPNTWTVQYNFVPDSVLRPYVGIGLHYTTLSIQPPGSEVISIENTQLGWVLQAGADLHVAGGWFVNADIRYLGGLEPTMSVKEPAYTITGYINPLLISAGVGFRW
jgi:outer membrane protein